MTTVCESSTITVSKDKVTFEQPRKAKLMELCVTSWFWNGFRAFVGDDGAQNEFTINHPSTMVETHYGIRGKPHTSQRIWARVSTSAPREESEFWYLGGKEAPDIVLHEHRTADYISNARPIRFAWFGADHHKRGRDVTDKVVQRLQEGDIVRASIGDFGDPAPHSKKVLQLWFSAGDRDKGSKYYRT